MSSCPHQLLPEETRRVGRLAKAILDLSLLSPWLLSSRPNIIMIFLIFLLIIILSFSQALGFSFPLVVILLPPHHHYLVYSCHIQSALVLLSFCPTSLVVIVQPDLSNVHLSYSPLMVIMSVNRSKAILSMAKFTGHFSKWGFPQP